MHLHSNKTLTIAIPTFNGDKYIALAIDSVLNQIKSNPFLESKTELVISDNASQDNVGGVVKKYKELYPNVIQYYRNKTNVGFDRNVDLAVTRATGEFVWILSDDDFLLDGAIEYVQNVIEKYNDQKLTLIYTNYASSTKLKTGEDDLCKDGNVFFQKTRFKSGLMSSNIVSKSIWQTSHVERFFDSGWIHFGYALEALNPLCGHKAYIINKELVKTGGEMKWGQGGTFIYFGFRLVEIFKFMPKWGYSPKTRKMADFVVKGGYPLFIPLAKAKGLKT
ncbi:MAG: glycosyltransferase family 2 protein, partial [Bacteroidia bacterium]|nr:glycosyltransferase family 2 protein [Bacteroidia bacterium]